MALTNTRPDLPGRPMLENSKGDAIEDIRPGRIIRGRDGKPIMFRDGLDAKYVADAASEFLGHDFLRVFFVSKKGDRQKQCALAESKGVVLSKADNMVVEAFAWLRARDRGARRKKREMPL